MTDSNCEHPAKRMKREDSIKTLDPFKNVHLDVFELILQHFRSPDVLQASLVSPLWYNVTATSSKCMEKVHLTINAPIVYYYKFVPIVPKKFLQIAADLVSERKYQNIHLKEIDRSNIDSIYQEILKILNGRTWKKVYFTKTVFDSEKSYHFIKIVEPTLENLSMRACGAFPYLYIQNIAQKPLLTFPKLKNLDLAKTHGILLDVISENCKTLQTLNLKAVTIKGPIQKILENNVDLKRLNLSYFSYSEVFPDEFNYSFKLKSFCFSIKKTTNDADDRIRLADFLKSQAESLEILKLDDWNGIETLKFLFGMPKLTEITIDIKNTTITTTDWEDVTLPENPLITSFYLTGSAHLDDFNKIFRILFNAMPNLKKYPNIFRQSMFSCPESNVYPFQIVFQKSKEIDKPASSM